MALFTWQAPPSLDPNGTLAALMMRGPDAYAQAAVESARARAAGVVGAAQAQAEGQRGAAQAWSGAIQGAGNDISRGIQQATDPEQQLRRQQVAAGQVQASDLAALDKAFTAPGGRDAILNALPGHLRPQVAASFTSADEGAAKLQEAQLKADAANTDYVGGLAEQVKAHGYDPQALQLAISHAKQTFASNPSLLGQLAPLEATLQANPTAETVRSIIDPILSAKDAAEKAVILPATPRGGAPATLVKPSGTVIASGGAAPAQPPTEPELALQASGGDPTKAMALLKPPPPPRPLEQQLLQAKASGDDAQVKLVLDTIAADANAKRDPVAQAQLEAIRNLTQQGAQDRLDEMNPQSPKNQQKFEQEYRTVLQRAMSTRSGGIGLEDQKVQQANHLKSLMDQFYDPNSGEWNIPRVQQNELALGLANLISPRSQAGEGMMKEFQQRTAKGDLAGALTYITGQPVSANTQAITQMLKDSIDRQGKTAEQNRQGELAYLRGLVPTDLNETRRQALEATSLNPLRQSRVATGPNGQRKLFVSTDGGKTWQ